MYCKMNGSTKLIKKYSRKEGQYDGRSYQFNR